MRKLSGFVSVGTLAVVMWSSLWAQAPGRTDRVSVPVAEPARQPPVVPVQFGIIQPADAAQDGPREAEDAGSPVSAEEIRQRLHDPVTITLEQVPLKDALHELLTKRKFDYWLDDAALVDASKKVEDIEVTCELHHVSLRAALDRIFRPAGLSWVCEDAGIRITSLKNAVATRFHRIYDVTPLLTEPEIKVEEAQPQKLSDPVSNPGAELSRVDRSEQLFGQQGVAMPRGGVATKNRSDVLIELVQGVTGGPPDHPWMQTDGEGGSIYLMQTANMALLVIRQNESTHAEIEKLLNELTSHQHAAMEEMGEKAEPAAPKDASRTIVRPKVRIVGKRARR